MAFINANFVQYMHCIRLRLIYKDGDGETVLIGLVYLSTINILFCLVFNKEETLRLNQKA